MQKSQILQRVHICPVWVGNVRSPPVFLPSPKNKARRSSAASSPCRFTILSTSHPSPAMTVRSRHRACTVVDVEVLNTSHEQHRLSLTNLHLQSKLRYVPFRG